MVDEAEIKPENEYGTCVSFMKGNSGSRRYFKTGRIKETGTIFLYLFSTRRKIACLSFALFRAMSRQSLIQCLRFVSLSLQRRWNYSPEIFYYDDRDRTAWTKDVQTQVGRYIALFRLVELLKFEIRCRVSLERGNCRANDIPTWLTIINPDMIFIRGSTRSETFKHLCHKD